MVTRRAAKVQKMGNDFIATRGVDPAGRNDKLVRHTSGCWIQWGRKMIMTLGFPDE